MDAKDLRATPVNAMVVPGESHVAHARATHCSSGVATHVAAALADARPDVSRTMEERRRPQQCDRP